MRLRISENLLPGAVQVKRPGAAGESHLHLVLPRLHRRDRKPRGAGPLRHGGFVGRQHGMQLRGDPKPDRLLVHVVDIS